MKVLLLTALLLAPLAALLGADPPATYCNPLPIPNYPVGFFARSVTNGEPDTRDGWYLGHDNELQQQYRKRKKNRKNEGASTTQDATG